MNGYALGDGRYMVTENGATKPTVTTDPDTLTDIWGRYDVLRGELSAIPGAFHSTKNGALFGSYIGGKGRVYYHDSLSDQWEPPAGLTAAETLRLLDKLASLLRRRALQYTPSYRGVSILASTYLAHPEYFTSEELPEKITASPVPNFTRPMRYDPAVKYLHKFDTRAAWLSSARTAPCGYGERRLVSRFDPTREGLWLVRSKVAGPHRPITRSGWYPTAIVRAAHHANLGIEVQTGWVWEHTVTALRQFSETLVQARSNAAGEAANKTELAFLESSIKKIYTRTFGRLEKGERGRMWAKQPHWYASLKAESARRVWRAYSETPEAIGIDVDSIFVLSCNPSPEEVFRTAPGKPRSHPLAYNAGKWRYEASYPVSGSLFRNTGGTGAAFSAYLRTLEPLNLWAVQ